MIFKVGDKVKVQQIDCVPYVGMVGTVRDINPYGGSVETPGEMAYVVRFDTGDVMLFFGEELVPAEASPEGYHLAPIKKGTLGTTSKIQEELDELVDAEEQGVNVLMLCELADLYGAIEFYLESKFPGFGMLDLAKMAEVTKRAFESGAR